MRQMMEMTNERRKERSEGRLVGRGRITKNLKITVKRAK